MRILSINVISQMLSLPLRARNFHFVVHLFAWVPCTDQFRIHCILKLFVFRTSVRLGEYDTSIDPDCSTSGFCAPTVINHMISHVIIHPDYKQGQYHHDIALVILKTPLNYTGELNTFAES